MSAEAPGLAKLDGQAVAAALAKIPRDRTFTGQEHLVFRVGETSVKLTKPGAFGARGSLDGYISQAVTFNEVFGDAIRIEGVVTLPGDSAPRVVASQPWIDGRFSTLAEVDTYMRRRGFLRMFDGAWWHPGRELQVTDA